MTQYDFGTMLGSDSGVQLATDLNSWRDALNTMHRGSTAPAYRQTGMRWLDTTTASLWVVKMFDGTDWIPLYSIDTVNHEARNASTTRMRARPSATPTPTEQGDMWYDSTRQRLAIGTSTSTRVFSLDAWEHITKATVSAVSSIVVSNLAPYRIVRVRGRLTTSANASFLVRISTDNGNTFAAGATDYRYMGIYSQAAASVGYNANVSYFALNVSQTVLADVNMGLNFTIVFYEFNQNRPLLGTCESGYWGALPGNYQLDGAFAGPYLTGARNAFQMFYNGGLASGHYTVEGIRGALMA